MNKLIVLVLVAVLFTVTLVSAVPTETLAARQAFRKCHDECKKHIKKLKYCVHFCLTNKLPTPTGNFLSESASVSSRKTITSEDLWARYRAELYSFLRQGDSNAMPNLQLVNLPYPAEWDQNPELLTNIADSVAKFGPTWQLTDKRFSKVYGEFITNVKVDMKNVDPTAFAQADQNLLQSEMNIDMATNMCDMKFESAFDRASQRNQATPNYDAYQARFCPMIDRANKMYDMYLYQYEITQVKAFGPNFILYRNVAKYGQAGRTQEGYKYVAQGSLARFAQNAEKGQTNGFEVKISEKTSTYTKTTYSQSIGLGYEGFIGSVPVKAGVKAEVTKMDLKTSLDELQIVFGAEGYKAIPVQPSRTWYSPEVVSKYRNGPFRNPPRTPYFGKNGQVPMIPKTFIVVVKPKVEMYVTAEDAHEMQRTKNLGFNIAVAGITFDFAHGATLETKQETSKLFKVSIIGNSPTPQILAVDHHLL